MASLIEEIRKNVRTGEDNRTVELINEALQKKIDPKEILDQGLMLGMLDIGKLFEDQEAYIPDMLIASRAMKRGIETLKPYLERGEIKSIGKIIVGTVKGDLHDIGKNLVSIMYESVGFEVIDMGIDVITENFIDAIKEHKPKVVSLSSLLTTTMNNQIDTLKEIKRQFGDNIKVLVGGAPVTKEWADSIGADGYASNAYGAAKLSKSFVLT